MRKKLVIKNTPTKLPISSTVLYTFLMWYFKVDNLFWGIFICCFGFYWIFSFISINKEERIDLNDIKEESTKDNFSIPKSFRDRLREKLIEEQNNKKNHDKK